MELVSAPLHPPTPHTTLGTASGEVTGSLEASSSRCEAVGGGHPSVDLNDAFALQASIKQA